jgi:oligosaccharide repeat unit polymerase
VASIAAGMVAAHSINIQSVEDVLWVILIMFGTLMIALPWKKNSGVVEIVDPSSKIDIVYRLLTILLWPVFAILLVAAIWVFMFASVDINAFKYQGGSIDFYYTMLPFDVRFFILATLLYNYSYLMIPLCLYYLQRRDKHKAVICLILSMNIIVYGATFFSRWSIIHFVLLFIFNYLLMYKSIAIKISKKMKTIVLAAAIGLFIAFNFITSSRFDDDRFYADAMNEESIVKNPTLYNLFDYLGQSTPNGFALMQTYQGETMHGTMATTDVRDYLSLIGLNYYDKEKLADRRTKLMGEEYDGGFQSFFSYMTYDFGIVGAIVVILLYFLGINKCLCSRMSINRYLLLCIWSEIPLLSIFYSSLSQALGLTFIYMPIYFYLNSKNNMLITNS